MSQPERLPAFHPLDEHGVDPMEAPEGMRAVSLNARVNPAHICDGCCLFVPRGSCGHAACIPSRRADGKYVIFVKA